MISVRIEQKLLSRVLKAVSKTGRTKTALIERGLELALKEAGTASK